MNRDQDYLCHYHQFEPMVSVSHSHMMSLLQYMKGDEVLLQSYNKMKNELPLINKDAPLGTSVFQTFFEYKYGKHSCGHLKITIVFRIES